MFGWNLTSEYEPPVGNRLYLITAYETSTQTGVAWYYKTRREYDGEDGYCITDSDGVVAAEFPAWFNIDLPQDEVDCDYLEYYVMDAPYAWSEMPAPSGNINQSDDYSSEISNIESLF